MLEIVGPVCHVPNRSLLCFDSLLPHEALDAR